VVVVRGVDHQHLSFIAHDAEVVFYLDVQLVEREGP
jgi:hypothetical protein